MKQNRALTTKKNPKILIIGGGIAGLTTLISLRQRSANAEITLVDHRDFHLKIPRLHEVLRHPSPPIKVPFKDIEDRFKCRFVRAEISLARDAIGDIASSQRLIISGESIDFDYLVLATGLSDPTGNPEDLGCLTLRDFVESDLKTLLIPKAKTQKAEADIVSIVGAGPTGVQFAFELVDYFERIGDARSVHVIDAGERPLANFHSRVGQYVLDRMAQRGIKHHPCQRLVSSKPGQLILEHRDGSQHHQRSGITLRLTNTLSYAPFPVNLFGQALINKRSFTRVYIAGDLAQFKGPIPTAVSAQSAVRKGKLIAINILKSQNWFPALRPYLHQDRGYIVSLGGQDAVGWIGSWGHIVKGSFALRLREVVDKQYDLLLEGIDTFII